MEVNSISSRIREKLFGLVRYIDMYLHLSNEFKLLGDELDFIQLLLYPTTEFVYVD